MEVNVHFIFYDMELNSLEQNTILSDYDYYNVMGVMSSQTYAIKN